MQCKKKRDPWREEMIRWRKFHFVQMLHLPVRLNIDAISNAERKYTNLIETNTYATDTYTHKRRHFDSLHCSIVDIWRILMMLSFSASLSIDCKASNDDCKFYWELSFIWWCCHLCAPSSAYKLNETVSLNQMKYECIFVPISMTKFLIKIFEE